MKIHDISIPIQPTLATWENSEVCIEREWVSRIDDGGVANVSCVRLGSHLGTHVDAPLHFIPGGGAVAELSLDDLVGPCQVVELPELSRPNIAAADLESAAIDPGCERVLFKTANSRRKLLRDPVFHPEFIGIAPDAAHWLVNRGLRAVGIDYLSVGSTDGTGVETHRILLDAGIAALEGLLLEDVAPGRYLLAALPLKIEGAEGAPMRAVLIEQ